MQFARWESMQSVPRAERIGEKPLRAELSNFILARAFEYLIQRIDDLGGDLDFEYYDAMVIGDQSAVSRLMHESQAGIPGRTRLLHRRAQAGEQRLVRIEPIQPSASDGRLESPTRCGRGRKGSARVRQAGADTGPVPG